LLPESRRQIERRLKRDGWYLDRRGAKHDIFAHPDIPEKIVRPRHRVLSPGAIHTIAKRAGWL